MSKVFIFTSTPYATNDIPLGSLIPNIRSPAQDALKKAKLKKGVDYLVNADENFSGRITDESKTFFKAAITRVFSSMLDFESQDTFYVTSETARRYELRQPNLVFHQLCQDDDVKKWLEEGYHDKQDSHLVIGFRTLLNARLFRKAQQATDAAIQFHIPTGAPAGDPTPTGEGDVKIAGGHGHKSGREGEFTALGERIYAICYRKIVLKFR